MRLKIEAGCGIREILKSGCGMKTERRDRDMLPFVFICSINGLEETARQKA